MNRSDESRRSGDNKLLHFLQRQEILTPDEATRIAHLAKETGTSLHEVLESEGTITEKDLALLLATSLGMRVIDLSSFALDAQVAREVKEELAIRYEILPIRSDAKTIDVATANPLDLESLKAVEFAAGKRVQPFVAARVDLRDALAHAYRLQESLDQFLRHVPGDPEIAISEIPEEDGDLRSVAQDAELPPVIKLANLVLLEGIKGRASDVHIEPGSDTVAVRYRVDGVLVESFRFPKWVQTSLVARLKVMSKLDITERRVPQDGRIQLRHEDKLIDLRVSSLPAQDGEKITIRILDAQGVQALDRIGLSDVDLGRMREALRRPQGMILVTGPTGSGKTTTLYALLKERFSPDINIVSIENPIEYRLKGINQVQVNEKQGLTFAGALRSILRQDPDVILIGEIRDAETAHIAFQAAQTGHLVLSTVHTNDAAGAISRLVDLGVEPYAVASGLHLVVAQRLLRRTCRACGVDYQPDQETQNLLALPADHPPLRRGEGCPSCRQTGFTGRTGSYELLPISPAISKMIEEGASEGAIRGHSRTEGSRSLLEDAIDKVQAGVTPAEEVLRVVQINENTPRCPGCQREVESEYAVCPHCSLVLRVTCSGCARPLNKEWAACPHCGGAPTGGTVPETSETEAEDTRSYTALIVDDTPTILTVVQNALEKSDLGLKVVPAENGTRALELAAQTRPDVVVLDINMPDMDGFEVCRSLRSDVRTAFVPVLLLTADDSEDSMARGFGVGADDYMTKPVRREALVARVRRMLERTYGASAVGTPTRTPPSASIPAPEQAPSGSIETLLLEEVRRTVSEVRTEVDRALAEGRAEAAEVRRLAEEALALVRKQ